MTTPPGRSLVAMISAKVSATSGCVVEGMTTAVLPARMTGATRETRASSEGSSGTKDRDDAGRLRQGEVEMRTGDRIHRAEELAELVRPAGVMDESVDREGGFVVLAKEARAAGAFQLSLQLAAPHLQHLGGAIENLPAQIGALFGPPAEGAAGRDHGIAQIFARGAGVLREGLVFCHPARGRRGRSRCGRICRRDKACKSFRPAAAIFDWARSEDCLTSEKRKW